MNNEIIDIIRACPMVIVMLPLMIFFIRSLILTVVLNIRMKTAKHFPTQENAWRVYKMEWYNINRVDKHPKI